MLKIKLSLLLFLISFSNFAQSGWDYIRSNNHIKAKESFEKDLSKDSMNIEALKGLIFLSDLINDDRNYIKYSRRLSLSLKDRHYSYLFPVHEFIKQDKKKPYVPKTLDQVFSHADDLIFYRKFEESKKLINEYVNSFNWSYIGPFTNINGYGYVEDYEIERDNFDIKKTYINNDNTSVNWIQPDYPDENRFVNFGRHTAGKRSDGVFYAYTSFQTSQDLPNVTFALTRHYPIKIWIDKKLVYADAETIGIDWDGELIQMNLQKGQHEILIKYAIGDYFSGMNGGGFGEYDLSSLFGGYEDAFDFGSDYDIMSDYDFFSFTFPERCVLIRMIDQQNKSIPIQSVFIESGIASVNSALIGIENRISVNYFKNLIEKNPNDLFNFYALYLAAIKTNVLPEVEEFIIKKYQANSNITLYKYVAAETYEQNGKSEKSDRIYSTIQMKQTPVMNIIEKSLKEIDMENEPEAYLEILFQMHQLSPSNLSYIRKIVNYYNKSGAIEDRKAFVKEKIQQFPEYKGVLEDYLKDENRPNDYNIGNKQKSVSNKDREKKAMNSIKKYYNSYDYTTLIKKYKGENNSAKVLSLYNEMIAVEPNNNEVRFKKAEYLYNLNRLDEAIAELNWLTKNFPYISNYYERLGDIYADKKDNEKALEYYMIVKNKSAGSGYGLFGYGGNSINNKISKITGLKQLKNKFITKTYDEIVADSSWKEKYHEEESVVTAFTTDVYLEEEGTVRAYSKMVIEILSEAGAKSWTQYDFGFMGNLTITKIIKKNGAEVQPEESGGMIVFKNLERGDRIRIEGNSQFPMKSELGNYLFQFALMSFHAPVHYAKLEVAAHKDQKLVYHLHQLNDPLQTKTENDYRHYKWEYKDIQKSVDEDAMLDRFDGYALIQLGTMDQWSKVVDWYLSKTYRKTEPNYEVRAICDSIIKPGMTDQEKVITIYNFITKEITYSFTELLQSNYIPRNADLTISSRVGDCKDVATLMITMLRYVGIESYYVLVKTNQWFHMKTLPSTFFDHVITAYVIDGKMNYLDLTSDYYPHYALNENDINAWGLLIKKGVNDIFLLPSDHTDENKNTVTHEIQATLQKDKTIKLEVSSEFSGLEGGNLREIYFGVSKENFNQELLFKLGRGAFENISIDKSSFTNLEEFEHPLKGKFNITSYNYSDQIINIHFMKIPFMVNIKSSTLISSPKRYNTIDLTQITETAPCLQKITLTMTEGTKLMYIPKDVELKSRFGVYRLTFKKLANNKIYIEKYQQFYTTQILLKDFVEFREFYLKMLEYDRTKIAFN